MKRLIMVCTLAVFLGSPGWASEKPEDAAQAAAESWLKVVDEGKYEASWDEAAKLFKDEVTKEQWSEVVTSVRGPLGKLVSRKLKAREYTEQTPGGPDGKFVNIQYDTVFEKKAVAVETVTPTLDPDGAWRVTGYSIR